MVTNANWLCSCSLRGPVGIWTWSFWWLTLRNLAPFLSHCQWHMKKKKKKNNKWEADEGDREVGDSLIFSRVSPHTWRTNTMTMHLRVWWEATSRWQCSQDNTVTGRLACIRCWWVAADQMMSEGTMPAQAVRYVVLAGPERSSNVSHDYS